MRHQGKGHFGTGDLEITIKKVEDFEKTKSSIDKAYGVINQKNFCLVE
jgi:predicted transport protein